MELPGRRPRGRPERRFMDAVKEDMQIVGVRVEDTEKRVKWKTGIGNGWKGTSCKEKKKKLVRFRSNLFFIFLCCLVYNRTHKPDVVIGYQPNHLHQQLPFSPFHFQMIIADISSLRSTNRAGHVNDTCIWMSPNCQSKQQISREQLCSLQATHTHTHTHTHTLSRRCPYYRLTLTLSFLQIPLYI